MSLSFDFSHFILILRRDLRRTWPAFLVWLAYLAFTQTLVWYGLDSDSVAFLLAQGFLIGGIIVCLLLGLSIVREDPVLGNSSYLQTRPVGGTSLFLAKLVVLVLILVLGPLLVRVPLWLALGYSFSGLPALSARFIELPLITVVLSLSAVLVLRRERGYLLSLLLLAGALSFGLLVYCASTYLIYFFRYKNWNDYFWTPYHRRDLWLQQIDQPVLWMVLLLSWYVYETRRPGRAFCYFLCACILVAPLSFGLVRLKARWAQAHPSPELQALHFSPENRLDTRFYFHYPRPYLRVGPLPEGTLLNLEEVFTHALETKSGTSPRDGFKLYKLDYAFGDLNSRAVALGSMGMRYVDYDLFWGLGEVAYSGHQFDKVNRRWFHTYQLGTPKVLSYPELDFDLTFSLLHTSIIEVPALAGASQCNEGGLLRIESCEVEGDFIKLTYLTAGSAAMLRDEDLFFANKTTGMIVPLSRAPEYYVVALPELSFARLRCIVKAADFGLVRGMSAQTSQEVLSKLSLIALSMRPLQGSRIMSFHAPAASLTFPALSGEDFHRMEENVRKLNEHVQR